MDRPQHPKVFRSWKVERLKDKTHDKPFANIRRNPARRKPGGKPFKRGK